MGWVRRFIRGPGRLHLEPRLQRPGQEPGLRGIAAERSVPAAPPAGTVAYTSHIRAGYRMCPGQRSRWNAEGGMGRMGVGWCRLFESGRRGPLVVGITVALVTMGLTDVTATGIGQQTSAPVELVAERSETAEVFAN